MNGTLEPSKLLKKKKFLITLLLFLFLTACNDENENYVFFTSSEHINDSLTECLDDQKVKYKIDEEENLVVEEDDSDKAIAKCS
ncbi:hypothetical protein [Psychrobacillus sp. NPDC093200]|uniref:hypothetical protein n=1 Tax=Psychrobacillus sp. NPDC093200 TaxID=3390656 RepID=UPI0011A4169D